MLILYCGGEIKLILEEDSGWFAAYKCEEQDFLNVGEAEEGEDPLKASLHCIWVTAGSVVNHQIHMCGLQEEK